MLFCYSVIQIKIYDWISKDDAKAAIARLEKAFFGDDETKEHSARTIDFEKSLQTIVNVMVPVPVGREPAAVTELRIANGGERDVINGTTTIVGRVCAVVDIFELHLVLL